ncbi:Ultraviolet-B receptor uvr8 [Mortierella sp. NVP85]|nr:Ultraviolet-B receptor uvr8 [Mortierella sp. NVP85]
MPRSLFAFGSNGNGQLGIGSDEDTSTPLPVQFNPRPSLDHHHDQYPTVRTPFLDFAAGGNHTALITRVDQLLYMTGSNKDNESLLTEPTQVFTRLPLTHTNSLPSNVFLQDEVPPESESQGPTRWRSVACGWAFTIAVTEPEPELGPEQVDARDIGAGRTVNRCNKVYTWGSGAFGELGLGPNLTKTGRQVVAIEGGALNSLGKDCEIIRVRAGLRHVLLLAKENSNGEARTVLLGWGNNRQGQLGILTRQRSSSEQGEAPALTDKELRGKFMEPTFILMPKDLLGGDGPVPKIIDMACGQNHSLILFSDGSVYSSGLNKYGQLGPHTPSVPTLKQDFRIGFERVQGLPFVNSISCGWNHNAAMDTRPLQGQGRTIIYLWGRNDHGQLGNGVPIASMDLDLSGSGSVPSTIVQVRLPITAHDTPAESEEIISYCCGSEHTLAMTRSGNCYAWGWNEHGNCGNGCDTSTTTTSAPTEDLRDVPAPRKVQFPTLPLQDSASDNGQAWVVGGYGSSWVWI